MEMFETGNLPLDTAASISSVTHQSLIRSAPQGVNAEDAFLIDSIDINRSVASSRDKLIDDVHQAIWSLSQGSNTVPGKINFEKDAKSRNLDELRLDLNAAKPYLDGFIEHLNHLLYLTSEAELQQAFREVLHGNSPQQEKVIELCLILALGANCIGNVAAHGQWYREARSRLYHFGEWIDDLRLMRILTFSCLYHLNFSPESSCHLLELALQMGLACGLDSKEFPISGVVEPERSHWLRVWESLRFLHIVRSP
jgi:hypothetical protein